MRKNCLCALLVVCLLSCGVLSAFASSIEDWEQKWDNAVSDESVVSLSPGADESQVRFRFLVPLDTKTSFRIGEQESLTESDEVSVERSLTGTGRVCCTVTADGLKPDTNYYYAYSKDGVWSKTYSFRTAGETLTALFVSDSQLGRSGNWRDKDVLLHDVAGWDTTLCEATASFPEVSLCLSAGDQAEIGFSEKQYRLFLAPDVLRSLPIATTIGNHEFYYPCLNLHFAHPNRFGGSILHSLADEPYYFVQKNVLFVVLDTNNPITWDHEAVLERAVQQYSETKWRVVMMHHSLYSCEDDFLDAPNLRDKLVPLLQKYGVDLVLSGHTHRYSRSFPLWDDKVSDSGITFLEGGCCSGCNCKASPEDLPEYTSAGYAKTNPVYSVLEFQEQEIKIRAFAVEDGKSVEIDSGVVLPCPKNDESAHSSQIVRVLQSILSVLGRAVSVWFR